MTDSIAGGGEEANTPVTKGFDIGVFMKHVAEVDTPIGKLYLFPLRVSDFTALAERSVNDAVGSIRDFLPRIASLSPDHGLKHERVGITVEQASILSAATVEAIADSYAESSVFRKARKGGSDQSPIVRGADEPATAFLERLLRHEVDEQVAQLKKQREQLLDSAQGIFGQVRKASQALGDTRQQFERLAKTRAADDATDPSIETRAQESHTPMLEHAMRMASERAEDREMIRLTGQMSAQSAALLEQLAASASKMLIQLDERDTEAKRSTENQLRIAVWAVAISAGLACASLVQDWCNNQAGDEWQRNVLAALSVANARTATLEVENQVLRLKMDRLGLTLADSGRQSPPPTAKTGGRGHD